MGLKAVIRARKEITDWGEWKRGMKMPGSAFPLSKQRGFCVRACCRWRVAKFSCLGKQYRLLVAYRPELERYISYLGEYDDGDTCVLARYEYAPSHGGWHLHANCADGTDMFGRTGNPTDRIPRNFKDDRRVEFGIKDDDQAFHVAAKAFGLIGKQLLELQ